MTDRTRESLRRQLLRRKRALERINPLADFDSYLPAFTELAGLEARLRDLESARAVRRPSGSGIETSEFDASG